MTVSNTAVSATSTAAVIRIAASVTARGQAPRERRDHGGDDEEDGREHQVGHRNTSRGASPSRAARADARDSMTRSVAV